MAMVKRIEMSDLSFTRPEIGPKDYVTRGPSGWPETFKRKIVDAQLTAFVKTRAPSIEVAELVDLFIATRELLEKPEPIVWFTIVGFLARRLELHPGLVPYECGIAFWAAIVIAQASHDAN